MSISGQLALVATAALVFLAGCEANTDIATPPTDVTYKPGFSQKRVDHTLKTQVRAYLPKTAQFSDPEEVKGASCRLDSKEFSATVVTPAFVNLPVIRGKPSPLTVSCAGGNRKGRNTFPPFKPQTVFIGDPITMLVGNIASAVVTEASDRWQYATADKPVVGAFIE